MKLFQYSFYYWSKIALKNDPECNPYRDAVSGQTLYLGIFFISVVFRLFMELDVWQWVMNNWFYDYGSVHSKNFIAPTGVIAIICQLLVGYLLRRYYLQQTVIENISGDYEIDDPELKIHRFLPKFLLFFFIFFGVMIAGAIWWMVLICGLIVLGLELWVRNRFFWQRELLK